MAFIEATSNGVNTTVSGGGFGPLAVAPTTSAGPCQITHETEITSEDSAGSITISYGSNQSFTMTPNGMPEYTSIAQSFLFAAGDVITVSAAGAVVPAFSSNITFPSAITVTSPTAVSTVSKSGFSATWTATTSEVHILFIQHLDSSHSTAIDCAFAGSSGSGAVPAAALTALQTTVTTAVSISTQTQVSTQAGAYAVTLQANAVGLSTDNASVQP